MRWLVVRASPPLSCCPSGTAHAHPPGPGLPRHEPSVYTTVLRGGGPVAASGSIGTACPSRPRLPRFASLGRAGTSGRSSEQAHPVDDDPGGVGSGGSMGVVLFDGVSHQLPDVDPTETREWLDAFDDIVAVHGETRARYLLLRLLERAGHTNVG